MAERRKANRWQLSWEEERRKEERREEKRRGEIKTYPLHILHARGLQ
jgi:hypothetical protein